MSWSRYFRRRSWDRERSRELDAYLQIETDDNLARGMSEEAARAAAQRKLGNATWVREEIYRMNTLGFVETLWQDLRYALRLLRLNPAFTLVAIASLALGIGANTAMFQLLDTLALRPLPVQNPNRLAIVKIPVRKDSCCIFNTRYANLTTALWDDIRHRQQAFSGMAAWGGYLFNLSVGGELHFAETLIVSSDFFQVLGVQPAQGRLLTAADDQRGCQVPSAVISDSFWHRQLGGVSGPTGRKLTLEGHTVEIVGVTPPSFFGLEVGHNFDVAVPFCAEPLLQGQYSVIDQPWGWWLAVTGRLKPGWTVERASAHLAALAPGIFAETLPSRYDASVAKAYRGYTLNAVEGAQGYSEMRDDYRTALQILLAIAGLVLLIACANLANLMLARASIREREIAIRQAIGASRGRLIRQLLAESLLLSGAGAVAGAGLATALNARLVSFLASRYGSTYLDLAPDWRILGFTAALAIVTSIFFGLTPALRATRTAPGTVMKATSRGITAARERFGLRRVLVVVQVALSLVLLVGALLFVRSFRNLMGVDSGFRPDGVLEADIDFSRLKLTPDATFNFDRELLRRLQSIPGIDSAGHTSITPLGGAYWGSDVEVNKKQCRTAFSRVSPRYFLSIGIPVLAGRDFNQRDTLSSPYVTIVNQTFVRQYLGEGNPIGRTFLKPTGPKDDLLRFEIVGVVRDSKYRDLKEKDSAQAFFPFAQDTEPDAYLPVFIHSSISPAALIPALKRTLAELHPEIGYEFHVFRDEVRRTLQREELMATLSGLFGLLAAVLATIGLYGVMSYTVARRRNEIGIRVALGAERGDVVRMVLGEAALLLALGLAAGSALAWALGEFAATLLFGLQPRDPASFAFSIALLAAVATGAAWLPARRAATLDPTVALREE